jgi:GntR family transcriptional regulator
MPDNRPVYLRLRDEIAAAIIDGRYPEGAALPSVRAFAAEQGANPLTVAKAYQQFQTDGLIRVQRGVGMFVREGAAQQLRETERSQFLEREWPQIRDRMARLGIDPADVLDDA